MIAVKRDFSESTVMSFERDDGGLVLAVHLAGVERPGLRWLWTTAVEAGWRLCR